MTPIQAAAPFPSTVGIGPASIGTTTGHIAGYHYGGTIPAVAQTFANSLGSDNGVGAGIAGTYTQTWNGLANPFLSNTYVTNGCFSTPAAPVTSRSSDTSMPIPSATAVSSIYGTALAPHVAGPGMVNIGDDEGYRQRTPGLKIPTYTHNGDIQLFLERMEIYFSAAGTRDTQKANLVLSALDDLSLNAVLKQKQVGLNIESYEALKVFLEKRFVSPESGCTARLNFRVVTQQANERPEDFYTKLLGIAKEAYPTMTAETVNELVLHKFCDSIADPTIRLKLLEHDPKNTDDAVSYCSKLIKLRHYAAALENNSTTTTNSALNSAQLSGSYNVAVVDANESRQGDSYRPQSHKFRYTSSGFPICNFCNKEGHIERNCWRKKDQYGSNHFWRNINIDGNSKPFNRDRNAGDERDRNNYHHYSDVKYTNAERYHENRSTSPNWRDNGKNADDDKKSFDVVYKQAGTICLAGQINNNGIHFILDTGSNASLISNKLWQQLGLQVELVNNGLHAISANYAPIKILGAVNLTVKLESASRSDRPVELVQRFLVADHLSHDAILGMDFVIDYKVDIFASDRELRMAVEGNNSTHRLLSDNDNCVESTAIADMVINLARSCDVMAKTVQNLCELLQSNKAHTVAASRTCEKANSIQINALTHYVNEQHSDSLDPLRSIDKFNALDHRVKACDSERQIVVHYERLKPGLIQAEGIIALDTDDESDMSGKLDNHATVDAAQHIKGVGRQAVNDAEQVKRSDSRRAIKVDADTDDPTRSRVRLLYHESCTDEVIKSGNNHTSEWAISNNNSSAEIMEHGSSGACEGNTADTDRESKRYPIRDRNKNVRFSEHEHELNTIRVYQGNGSRAKIFMTKYLLLLSFICMIMAADEAITATADNLCANNLAYGLSNAEGCTTRSNDTLITMVKTGKCLDEIQLYFTRLTFKLFDIYTCSKEYTRLLNYTVQLFNTRPILYSFHLLSVKLIAQLKTITLHYLIQSQFENYPVAMLAMYVLVA
jgi:predicted aspartyl protease